MNLEQSLRENFARYSGMTIQQRAIVDARDGLKPSARQAMYAQYLEKITHKNPYKKSAKSVATGMDHFYVHGDTSLYGLLMRLGKPFTSRYPLEDVQGNVGDLRESGNEAAYRYTEMRLSELSSYLFKSIDKGTIDLWYNNYDDTEQYPSVLPSLGFYNIVNGTSGIAVAIASSIPQFNLNEVNEALIKLLWNPNISFDEIYCVPDFATGATLINEAEVKESLRTGNGKACKLRATLTYDSTENCLLVTEIPYGVYTNTICKQLASIANSEDNRGIDRCIDLTKEGIYPCIKIYLTKGTNPNKVAKMLFKETSLQYHYGINMEMLKDGKKPQIFGWKEALETHLEHEKIMYRKAFEYDKDKLEARLHIVVGILTALAHIEEVIQIIKSSTSSTTAKANLMKQFGFSDAQAKAILDIKLVRLANLEIEKFEQEKKELTSEIIHINEILNNQDLFFKEIEKGFREVMKKFGDERRTKVLNLESENDDDYEAKLYIFNLTNKNNVIISEGSTLMSQRKGGVGSKFKLDQGEYIISTISGKTNETALFFSNKGNAYSCSMEEFTPGQKISFESILPIKSYEKIGAMTTFNENNHKKYIIFVTKKGMIKKTVAKDFNTKRKGGLRAIDMENDDEIVSTIFVNEEKIGVLTEKGYLLICQTKDINAVGRIAKGVRGIKLSENDYVVSAKIVPDTTKEILSISNDGLSKRTSISETTVTGRYTKGSKLQKLRSPENWMVDFLSISEEKEILIVSNSAQIRVKVDEISFLGKGAQGTCSIKMAEKDSIIGLSKF